MTADVFEGRIVAVVPTGAAAVELDLVSDAGRSQRVLAATPPPGLLRGRVVRVAGRIDPNGILVAATLIDVSPKNRRGWLVPAGVAVLALALAVAAGVWFVSRGQPPEAIYSVRYATEQTNMCHVAPGSAPDTVSLLCTFDGSRSHTVDAGGAVTAWTWTYRVAGPEATHVATGPVTTLPMDCATFRGAPLLEFNGLRYVQMHVELRVEDDAGRVSAPYDLGPVNLVTHRQCGYPF
jgi:hypothetical protein